MRREEWRWKFLSFELDDGTQPVQSWFDGLPPEVRDEIGDLIRHLEKIRDSLWRRPEFDPLVGEGGISELRASDVRLQIGGKVKVITARIYGFFGPGNGEYTFLHGTNKRTKNDKAGKRIGKDRLNQITNGLARVHEFKF